MLVWMKRERSMFRGVKSFKDGGFGNERESLNCFACDVNLKILMELKRIRTQIRIIRI